MGEFFSQNGEDVVLSRIFSQKTGVCVEVGAHDGVVLSNTYHFEQAGWKCILVEPNPVSCREIRGKRSRQSTLFECAASHSSGTATLNAGTGDEDIYSTLEPVGQGRSHEAFQTIEVRKRTLDSILDETGVSTVDFISIDVEGHELHVLHGLTLSRWNPRILLVEDNSDFTDGAVTNYLRCAGYFRFYRSGANDWYAPRGASRVKLLMRIVASGKFSWKGLVKVSMPAPTLRQLLLLRRSVAARFGRRETVV